MIMHHVCIQSSCYEQSKEFYTKILGFEVISETAGFHSRGYNTWLKLDDFMIELQTEKKDEVFTPWTKHGEGIVHMAFAVDGVVDKFNELKEKGCKNFKLKNGEELYVVEGTYLFKIKAPEGTEIEFRDVKDVIK